MIPLLILGSRNCHKCREMAELIAPPWGAQPVVFAVGDPVG